MSWSARQRGIYLLGFFLLLIVAIGIPVYLSVRENPTCFDGTQNGDETGVDCGGSCDAACSADVLPLLTQWARFFEVAPGIYSAVALVENQNLNANAQHVPYTFKLRDTDNLLVAEVSGRTFVPTAKLFPVFVSGITTGNRIPSRVLFSFDAEPAWRQVTDARRPEPVVAGQSLTGVGTAPRLEATIANESFTALSNIEVVALVFDQAGNAVAASRTFIDFLAGESEERVIFTWPRSFAEGVVRVNVIPIEKPR